MVSRRACRRVDRPGGPAIVSGIVRRLTNCASSNRNGNPPKWSPCRCEISTVPIMFGSIPNRRMAINDDAPQSTRKLAEPAET